ncbi:MAG TPA: thrombospondin type 3 repeat-containing protein [Polyangia bacterium]|nr:thrombospondin type 3 repeat-containing protein [Polyangia bacterium]
MSSEPRSSRGALGGAIVARRLRSAIALALVVGAGLAAAPAVAAPSLSRDPAADSNDDWTLRTGLGLDLGAGGTITDFNVNPPNGSTLFFTSVRATLDIKYGFAAMLALRQWWLPGPNHAFLFGLGTRFEPYSATWGRVFADLALGPASTGYAWTFGYDVGGGVEFDLPDVPGFSLGPYFRFADFINPDRRDSNDGLAWSLGASFTYHFGRAALAPKSESTEPHARRGAWHVTIPDTDHDGVGDDEDQCKTVPAGRHPDPFRPGCPEGDQDGDGVPDVDDACPVTPPGDKPDPKRPGCPFIDTDGDGVSDADDVCPTKWGPASSDPAKNGCPDGKHKPPAAAEPAAPAEESAPKAAKKHHHHKTEKQPSTGGERIN